MNPNLSSIQELVQSIGNIVGLLPPILIAVAVVYFFWGIIKFIMAGDDEAKRSSGKQAMIWGIIGILVMVSLWGIVVAIQNIFDIGGQTTIPYPTV